MHSIHYWHLSLIFVILDLIIRSEMGLWDNVESISQHGAITVLVEAMLAHYSQLTKHTNLFISV